MKKNLLPAFILFSLLANGQTFLPGMPETDDDVKAIYRWGSTVYIGGHFLNVNGSPKKYLASFDAATGTVNPWNPDPDGEIYALGVAAGKLIVVGDFDTISQQPRHNICMYDLATGLLDSWTSAYSATGRTLAVYNNTFYYVTLNGTYKIYCVDAVTGNYTGWQSQNITGILYWAMLRSGNYLYVGGDLDGVGPYNLGNLMRFDATTGMVDTAFHPATSISNDWITSLADINSNIYVGGSYTDIGGQSRNGIASFNPNGTITSFNPYCSNHQIWAIFPSSQYLWIGGNSYVLGGYNRARIAEINTATQYATCWDATAESFGWLWTISIFVSGDTVYSGSESPSVGHRHFNVCINSPRPHPDSIMGPAVVNQFQTTTYSIPLNPGNTYYWSVTGGSGSSTTNSINITWGAGPVGSVSVVESNPVSGNCYSDTLTLIVSIQSSVGINSVELHEDISIMPNPAGGQTVLQAEALLHPPFSVSVFDVSGRLLFFKDETEPYKNFPLDLSVFNSGIYFVQVKNLRGVTTGKLVKE